MRHYLLRGTAGVPTGEEGLVRRSDATNSVPNDTGSVDSATLGPLPRRPERHGFHSGVAAWTERRADLPGAADPPALAGTIDLRPLFAPRSIAVVGASPRSWIAETVRDNLRVTGSATRCHFVNPRYEELHGQPCYPSLADLPERPDVALVALNPLRAGMVTRDAAAAGIPAVIIPGGGVVEGGEAAAAMQLEVAEIAREHGIALVGPNCMGVMDLTVNSSVYIGDVSPYLPRGGVAGIAQSGSVTDAFIQSGSRVGFTRIISCGTEAVLDVCDYLAYCLDDPETTSVILFLEGFKRPERFLALADRALELGKPIMAVKVGRSDQAQASAVAHSGSLAGEARVTDAALDAAGVIRCADLDELLETAELVEGLRRTGRSVGRGRTGVVTVSTGEASLVADLAPRTGIDLPPLPETARARILEHLPTMGYIGNPMDPWGAADPAIAYGAVFESMAASDAYDVLVLVHDFPYKSMPAEVATANDVTAQLLGRDPRPAAHPAGVRVADVRGAAARDEGRAGRAGRWGPAAARRAGGVQRDRVGRRAGSGRGPGGSTVGRGGRAWPALGADRTAYGLGPVATNGRPSRSGLSDRHAAGPLGAREPGASSCRRPAGDGGHRRRRMPTRRSRPPERSVRRPVVAEDRRARACRTRATSASSGSGSTETRRSGRPADDLLATRPRHGLAVRGLLVEPMAERRGRAHRRAPPRPVVRRRRSSSGSGACFTEMLDDVAIRLAPVDRETALAMLEELARRAILDGVRGSPPVDRGAVADLIVALSGLGDARPDIVEVDLNPVIASATGAARRRRPGRAGPPGTRPEARGRCLTSPSS